MANSKYEYVKTDFEVKDKILPATWIVVRLNSRDYDQFSETHEFDKPNDPQALNLMNSCALAMLEEFIDIVFVYGASDQYSFVFNKTSMIYQRRVSKIVSITVSFFSSLYVMKWKEFFPEKDLRSTPSFVGQVMCFPSKDILQDYIFSMQNDCHINYQYNACLWMLIKSGKTKEEAKKTLEEEAQTNLKDTQTQCHNELLFKQFGINYNTLPATFRKGSSIFRDKVEEIVKYKEDGNPVKRFRTKLIVEHCDMKKSFWITHPTIFGSD